MFEYITCPPNKSLYSKFDNPKIILRISSIEELKHIASDYNDSDENIHQIVLQLNDRNQLHKLNDYINLPITVLVETIDLPLENFPKEIKIYLSSNIMKNYSIVKELAKSGYHSGILLNNQQDIKWDALIELLIHYRKNANAIGHIEPFNYILNSFSHRKFQNFSGVFFNDYNKFIHLNEKGDIAFSLENLSTNKYFADMHDDISIISSKLDKKHKSYYTFFLERHECVSCPGWTICNGTFSKQQDKTKCKAFFLLIIDYKNQLIEEKSKSN